MRYHPPVNKNTTARKVDELDAFYASMGDVLKAEPAPGNSIFSASTLTSQPDSTSSMSVQPSLPAPELPALPTAAKMDKDQLAGIAAAQAAEQLAKAEEKRKRKAASMTSTVGIAGGGLKVKCEGGNVHNFATYPENGLNLFYLIHDIINILVFLDFQAIAEMVDEASGAPVG